MTTILMHNCIDGRSFWVNTQEFAEQLLGSDVDLWIIDPEHPRYGELCAAAGSCNMEAICESL